jgi:hypothetical protein
MSIELALTNEEEGEGNYAEVAAGKWALGKWDCCIIPWKLLDRSLESAAPRFQLFCTGQWRVLRIGCVMYLKTDGLICSYIPRSISYVLLKTVANNQLFFWLWLHLFPRALVHNKDKALTTCHRFPSILTPEIFFTDSSQDGIMHERCTALGISAVHSLYGANFVLVVPDILR